MDGKPDAESPAQGFVAAGHFYSPLGDPREVRRFFHSDHYAAQAARVDAMLDLPAMVSLWHEIAARALVFPFEQSPDFRYCGKNGQFPYYDATVLSGLLALINPRQIVEIGAGWSSAAMFDTLDRLEGGRLERFTTIDPDLSRIRRLSPPDEAELIEAKVQSVPLERFDALGKGDVLFIDSSHVLKTGSDVHYEFLLILPRLKPGVIVHIHDVFYPFEYPRHWAVTENRSWNEAYAVDLMLTHGRGFEIMFFNDAFLTKCAADVRAPGDMFERFESFPTRHFHRRAGSIWLRKTSKAVR